MKVGKKILSSASRYGPGGNKEGKSPDRSADSSNKKGTVATRPDPNGYGKSEGNPEDTIASNETEDVKRTPCHVLLSFRASKTVTGGYL